MTNTEGHEDSFPRWSTEVLMGICFRITPHWERDNWVITGREFRYDQDGQEIYTKDQLRAFAVEQLEDYGITEHDVNCMKS